MNIDIRQSAQVSQMQEEIMFLKGQNEAAFAMLSYLTEQNGGTMTIPKDFNQQVIGSSFFFDRNEAGDYEMKTIRESTKETAAPYVLDGTVTIE
ncbi:hypothetical protein [Paenibacillus sp. NPDC057967]|uniref:hypothetical protein n=1 Tax=Paenibacillus sp. NPDC057967 TaxID=3346293 RepID=UPI0036D8E01A